MDEDEAFEVMNWADVEDDPEDNLLPPDDEADGDEDEPNAAETEESSSGVYYVPPEVAPRSSDRVSKTEKVALISRRAKQIERSGSSTCMSPKLDNAIAYATREYDMRIIPMSLARPVPAQGGDKRAWFEIFDPNKRGLRAPTTPQGSAPRPPRKLRT